MTRPIGGGIGGGWGIPPFGMKTGGVNGHIGRTDESIEGYGGLNWPEEF